MKSYYAKLSEFQNAKKALNEKIGPYPLTTGYIREANEHVDYVQRKFLEEAKQIEKNPGDAEKFLAMVNGKVSYDYIAKRREMLELLFTKLQTGITWDCMLHGVCRAAINMLHEFDRSADEVITLYRAASHLSPKAKFSSNRDYYPTIRAGHAREDIEANVEACMGAARYIPTTWKKEAHDEVIDCMAEMADVTTCPGRIAWLLLSKAAEKPSKASELLDGVIELLALQHADWRAAYELDNMGWIIG